MPRLSDTLPSQVSRVESLARSMMDRYSPTFKWHKAPDSERERWRVLARYVICAVVAESKAARDQI